MVNQTNKTGLLAGVLMGLGLTAAAASRPNILLIFSDDHAKHSISCYGNKDIKTPGLDRLANEGMRFDHALTPNSFCTPSRAVALTGKYSHKNGVTHLNQPFDGSQQTFPKLLQAAGYETSIFGKWHLLSRPTGFDHFCVMKNQGQPVNPRLFEPQHKWVVWDQGRNNKESLHSGGRVVQGFNNDVVTDEALEWLKEKREPNKPFCMLLHPKPPHEPYKPAPPKYKDFLKDVTIPEPATHIKSYYRLVKNVDDNVARVLAYLDESGLAENTLVIYTSDQGFSLGEHGFYNKQWMYENSLHQPLLVRYPGVIKAGTVHSSMVNHVDLAPTLLDFVGLPIPDDMQGYSLKPILEGKAEKVRDASYYHFYEHGKRLPEMIGVRTERYKLIHYPGMEGTYQWELFDLQNDPDEMKNQYGNPEYKEIKERMLKDLRKLIKDLDDPVDAPGLK